MNHRRRGRGRSRKVQLTINLVGVAMFLGGSYLIFAGIFAGDTVRIAFGLLSQLGSDLLPVDLSHPSV